MKLGFLTHRLTDIAKAGTVGFDAIELSLGAFGVAGDGDLDPAKIDEARQLASHHQIEITALAYYDAAFKPPAPATFTKAYERVFDAAERLGVRTIASMSGFDAGRDWTGNIKLFAERFGPVAELAERRGVRVAFENWMGFWGKPPFKPMNLGGSPGTWTEMFAAVPSKALGIEFDPSHLVWQGIDHLAALREWKERVYHVHAKDTEMLPDNVQRDGFNAGGGYRFRIPGYGQIDWAKFISALQEAGYDGGIAIEHEDPVYHGDRFDEGLWRGWQVLHPLVHPTAGLMARQ